MALFLFHAQFLFQKMWNESNQSEYSFFVLDLREEIFSLLQLGINNNVVVLWEGDAFSLSSWRSFFSERLRSIKNS